MTQATDPVPFAPGPRRVAPWLAARILLGGGRVQIGCIILIFGSVFFWAFAWNSDVSAWRFRQELIERTPGKFLSCNTTGFTEGGGQHRRGTPILETHYRYTVMGHAYLSSSFAKGPCMGGTLVVEYLRAQPEVSRIAGMRRQPFGRWMVLMAAWPGAGLVMIAVGWMQGRLRLRLLQYGSLAKGRLVEKKRTNMTAQNQPIYRLTFEFTAQDGTTGRVLARTYQPARFEDRAGSTLFYDPADPKSAVLLASFPRGIRADETGQPAARDSRWFLVLPALIMLGNGWYVYRHFS